MLLDGFIENNVIQSKELFQYVGEKQKTKRAVRNIGLSLSVLSAVGIQSVFSKTNSVEQHIQTPSTVAKHFHTPPRSAKSTIIASPANYGGKQFFTRNGSPVIATVNKVEATVFKNSMVRILDSSDISKIIPVGTKGHFFEPNTSYYTYTGAKLYAPESGEVVQANQADDSLVLKHQNNGTTYYSIITGIKFGYIKPNTKLKKGEWIGTTSDTIVKFAVARNLDNGAASQFIDSGLLIDQNKSNLLDYQTGKLRNSAPTAVNPSISYTASIDEKKAVEKLPYGKFIVSEAQKQNVDPVLVASLIKQESGYNADIQSKVGAEGLMQLMPGTAKTLGVSDPSDPQQNIKGGVKFLKALIEKYQDPELALYAYNAGPGNVDKWLKEGLTPPEFPFQETRDYGPKILRNYKVLQENAMGTNGSAKGTVLSDSAATTSKTGNNVITVGKDNGTNSDASQVTKQPSTDNSATTSKLSNTVNTSSKNIGASSDASQTSKQPSTDNSATTAKTSNDVNTSSKNIGASSDASQTSKQPSTDNSATTAKTSNDVNTSNKDNGASSDASKTVKQPSEHSTNSINATVDTDNIQQKSLNKSDSTIVQNSYSEQSVQNKDNVNLTNNSVVEKPIDTVHSFIFSKFFK